MHPYAKLTPGAGFHAGRTAAYYAQRLVTRPRLRRMVARALAAAVGAAVPAPAMPADLRSGGSVDGAEAEAAKSEPEFEFLWTSAPMRALYDRIQRCATSAAPVLITGESGTGKERAARVIHQGSARARGPFVTVNCATLPGVLLTQELLGAGGAAVADTPPKSGRLEAANGGTLFLNEIEETPPDVQGHLLEFVQDQVPRQGIGGARSTTPDVRIIAASRIPLDGAVREGRFRRDLYYHLHVLTVDMPPLRARGEDIMPLAVAALRRIEQESRSIPHSFTPAATEMLRTYTWPGNVRELLAVIRRAVVFATGPAIGTAELGIGRDGQTAGKEGGGAAVQSDGAAEADRRVGTERLRDVLARNGFNIKRAAEELRISRVTLYRLIDRFGIEIVRRRASKPAE